MIIEVRVNNCFSFSDPIVFSMKADMRNKKFVSNVHKENNFNILKTAGIYVRYFKKPRIDNYLRITVGTQAEMERLVEVLIELVK